MSLFLKKNFPFISLWRLSLGLHDQISYPPLDRVTHPGAKSDVRGWVGRQPPPKTALPATPLQHSSSPRESGPLSWPFCQLGCCREVLPPPHFPYPSFTLQSGMLPEATPAGLKNPLGLRPLRLLLAFKFLKDMKTWIWIPVQFKSMWLSW